MHRKPETGALALVTTRTALNGYSRRIILCAVAIVLVVNLLTRAILQMDFPWPLQLLLGSAATVLVLSTLGCVFAYFRFLLMRAVLRNADWQTVSGASRVIFVGLLPIARVVVADSGGDDRLAVDFAGPQRFARRLPGDMVPANMLMAQWRGLRVYSAFDGGSPTFGFRVRPKPVRNAFATIVQRS